ncbi:DUF4886 domain-containing protein [Flavobacterium sp. SM15]|uniref:Uncharacterized protein n=1 Tax=Flavobacterium enshiense DK69 TaxID=1107311 RepID=V6RY71_9FLAO|nr:MULTISPECIES: DUF4886 domain-containing protein [Flavobacterium]ESU19436.1 hypothetical protein FEDK69T_31790 [Flavobacterium enshiense DK69]KGO91489.1 hypothetical protein Q767_15940 [Flavobacterium enshiense DK69]MCG2611996.1 DUF4886 domain-containing protein [Flavobacterium sp. SM15]
MKNILLILITLQIISCNSQQKDTAEKINVLFIGNSLTYFYDMPQTVQKMLNETDPNIKIEQSTFPGMSLTGHLSDIITSRTENGISTRKKEEGEKTETEIKIAEKQWDIVILQTGTISVLITENRELKTNKAISDIKKLVSNPNCRFILFNTWPLKNEYPKQYCYPASQIDKSIKKDKCCSPVLESLEQEVKIINEAYDLVAKENDLIKSDNGNKFYEVRTKYPEIELYEDDSHPNKYGAFLNACIFYQMLSNKKVSNLKYNGEIEPKTAKLLKKIAE